MKAVMLLLMILLHEGFSRVIENKYVSWASVEKGNAMYGSYCNMKFDTQTLNFSYDCKGLRLSEFHVRDENGLVVGRAYVSRHDNGYGRLSEVSGVPHDLGGYGTAKDSTSFFMRCKYGYTQRDYGEEVCIPVPANALKGIVEGVSYGWRCQKGYTEDGEECLRVCSRNETLDEYGNCVRIPKNSVKVDARTWSCSPKYIQDSYGLTCLRLPAHAKKYSEWSSTWECDEGYYEESGKCLKIPENASKEGMYTWSCDEGYYEESGKCLKKKACNEKSINTGDGDCWVIPINAIKLSEFAWECAPGFIAQEDGGNYSCIVTH